MFCLLHHVIDIWVVYTLVIMNNFAGNICVLIFLYAYVLVPTGKIAGSHENCV